MSRTRLWVGIFQTSRVPWMFVSACLLTLFVYAYNRIQSFLTRVIFLRSNVDDALRELQQLARAAGSESEYLRQAAEVIARGSHLITSVEDRERVADLNLIAGRRAKISTAYDSALKYLRAGQSVLTEATWERNYRLNFSIDYLMAECELLTADKGAAENRLSSLAKRATNRHDFCTGSLSQGSKIRRPVEQVLLFVRSPQRTRPRT